jgi:hypothetical protein
MPSPLAGERRRANRRTLREAPASLHRTGTLLATAVTAWLMPFPVAGLALTFSFFPPFIALGLVLLMVAGALTAVMVMGVVACRDHHPIGAVLVGRPAPRVRSPCSCCPVSTTLPLRP